jgi:MFS superfamily sulfate permease-like transporter
MPVIAGVMALVGIGMIQGNDFRALRNRIDGPIFLVTVFAIIFLGLDIGLLVAIAVSVGFFVASASRVNLAVSRDGDEEHIVVTGNLFYASLDGLAKHLHDDLAARTVLDISRVPYCDAAADDMIEKIRQEREQHGGRLEIAPQA